MKAHILPFNDTSCLLFSYLSYEDGNEKPAVWRHFGNGWHLYLSLPSTLLLHSIYIFIFGLLVSLIRCCNLRSHSFFSFGVMVPSGDMAGIGQHQCRMESLQRIYRWAGISGAGKGWVTFPLLGQDITHAGNDRHGRSLIG